jgi:hypothetical protein
MTRLTLADIADEKPVRLTIELSARLHRELLAYAAAVNGGEANGAPPTDKLVPPMLERFMATDRGFSKARKPGSRS